MKKKAVLVAYVALLATPVAVMAQYPQLTEEAKAKYDKMITERFRHFQVPKGVVCIVSAAVAER